MRHHSIPHPVPLHTEPAQTSWRLEGRRTSAFTRSDARDTPVASSPRLGRTATRSNGGLWPRAATGAPRPGLAARHASAGDAQTVGRTGPQSRPANLRNRRNRMNHTFLVLLFSPQWTPSMPQLSRSLPHSSEALWKVGFVFEAPTNAQISLKNLDLTLKHQLGEHANRLIECSRVLS